MRLPGRPFEVGHASFTPFSPGGDIEGDLLQDRIVMIGDVDAAAAERLTATLLMLEGQDSTAEISLYINSAGGPIDAALAMYDAINLVACPVSTACIGSARGGAALLVAAGAPGRRAALPNSRFMLAARRGEFTGTAADAEGIAAEAARLHQLVVDLFSRHTRLSAQALEEALAKFRFLSATEAVQAGIVDRVIERPPRAWRGLVK
jgi:ATP-dependent Clp protease protease subunit